MPKYEVTSWSTVAHTHVIEVEADNEDNAKDMMYEFLQDEPKPIYSKHLDSDMHVRAVTP